MNLRVNFLTLLLVWSFSVLAYSVEADEINHLRELINSATMQAKKSRCRNAGMVMDNLIVLSKTPEFRALQETLTTSWQVALSNLDSVAENDMEKTVVLCSCWFLSEDDFISVLSSTALLVEEDKLNRNIFSWCQSPFESPLVGFLARNYKNPDVQKIIIRSRNIFKDQPERVKQYDMMLTGESRRQLNQFEEAMREGQPSGGILDLNNQNLNEQNTRKLELTNVVSGTDKLLVSKAVKRTQSEEKQLHMLFIVFGVVFFFTSVGIWIFRKYR